MKFNSLFEKENRKKMGDLFLNIGATALFNLVIQFALYPYLNKTLGKEMYGTALFMLSLVAIASGSCGTAANYSRLVSEQTLRPSNGDYNLFLLVGGILCAAVGLFYLWWIKLLTPITAILFAALLIVTAFRYYSDVEFKLKTSFVRYFFFYLAISVGYLLGLLVYRKTNQWMTALLTGEIFGLVYAAFASRIYRHPLLRPSQSFGLVLKSISFLLLSNLLENLTLNADRLLLYSFVDGTAVSVYYTASLFGKVVALLTVPVNSVIISYLIRYDKELSKKMWSVFTIGGIVCGAICLGACLLFSGLILPHFYNDLYAASKPYLFPAILSQILYFVSGVLLVVLLRFRGEKKQFFLNLGYAIVFFALTLIATYLFGLNGFVWASLLANALRLAVVIPWGFLPPRRKAAPPPPEETEQS